MMHLTARRAIIIGGLLALLAFATLFMLLQVRHERAVVTKQQAVYEVASKQHAETIGRIETLSRNAHTIEEWGKVAKEAEGLPPLAKTHFTMLAQVRTVELLADERDRLLANAGELLSVNENDPTAKENIRRAEKAQEETKLLLDKIEGVPGNVEWNKSLEYRKAYEKYRSLAFINSKEHAKALDILDDAVKNLRNGLDAVPKDNRTELAIEFLYKRAKEEEEKMANKGTEGGGNRPRALPGSRRDAPGSGGSDRQRQH
jgi:hypothetical protein